MASIYRVTYKMESKKTYTRDFFSEDSAQSEKTFQPGRHLTNGDVIKDVSYAKLSKKVREKKY